ncbi:hypothetical protein [Actinomycetospora soli]|uniref:hypothetical protein n=1 Tax=Actinomycetospora soli TaxID=2893887 RepID=UPI001E4B7E2A|nr:hypothetical protein [Actinomycetospora soli]MCD2190749.1 hypothetical protein [Actinomycetospora soli]
MFDVNWETRSHADIHAQLQGRGGGFTDAGGAWNSLASRLRDVAGSVERATSGIAATRTGPAAQAAGAAVGPMGPWATEVRTFSDAVGSASHEQNRALTATRGAVGPPVPRPPVTLQTWEGVGALAALDVDSAEHASLDAERRARAAMGRYQEFSSLRASGLPQFSSPSQPGAPRIDLVTTGGGGPAPGTGGGGAAVPGPAGAVPAPGSGGPPGPTTGGATAGTSTPPRSPGGPPASGAGASAGPGIPRSGLPTTPPAPGPIGAGTGAGGSGSTGPGGSASPGRGSNAGGAGSGSVSTGPTGAGTGTTGTGSVGTGSTGPSGTASTGFGPTGAGTGAIGTGSPGPTGTGPGPTSAPRPGLLEPPLGRAPVEPVRTASVLEPALGPRPTAASSTSGVPFAPIGGVGAPGASEQRLSRAPYLVEDDPDALAGELPRVAPPVIGG